jgi:hypothetical protein
LVLEALRAVVLKKLVGLYVKLLLGDLRKI